MIFSPQPEIGHLTPNFGIHFCLFSPFTSIFLNCLSIQGANGCRITPVPPACSSNHPPVRLFSSSFQFDLCNPSSLAPKQQGLHIQNAIKQHQRRSKSSVGHMSKAEHSLMYFTRHLGSVKEKAEAPSKLEIQYR